MASLNKMVKSVSGLLGTKDLTEWEEQFVDSIVQRTNDGDNTTSLSERQVVVLERIYQKHFAG